MRRSVMAAACALALGALPAAAQEIAAKAQEAEALLARGRVIEAIEALDAATEALWLKAPLAFRRSLWVSEKAAGFGIFNERPNNVFKAGERMLVYAEPIGFGWSRTGDIFRTDLAADVVFRSADGKELFSQKNFQKLELAGRVRNREFMVNFTYTLTGITPGVYEVETTLRDQITGKSGSFILPFRIQ